MRGLTDTTGSFPLAGELEVLVGEIGLVVQKHVPAIKSLGVI